MISSTEFNSASQKPYSIASFVENVMTFPSWEILSTLISSSTIASAIFGSLPFASAVDLIIDLIYDWYLSGAWAPSPVTTVAAPILAPLLI